MPELVWIIDPASGDLVVEGLEAQEALALACDLLPSPRQLNCAQPLATVPLPRQGTGQGPLLRVEALYHGSVVEGPGRRSVLQVRGCPLRCRGCAVPQTHPSNGGVVLSADQVVEVLLDPVGQPRDGITVIGGEPFAQPVGLAAVLSRVKARGIHTTVYTGYALAALAQHSHPAVRAALELTDLLIDGPFVEDLAEGAGEWRGSRNQRLIANPAAVLARAASRAASA